MLSRRKWVNTGAGSLVHAERDSSVHPQTVSSSLESGVWGPLKASGEDALCPVIQTQGWGSTGSGRLPDFAKQTSSGTRAHLWLPLRATRAAEQRPRGHRLMAFTIWPFADRPLTCDPGTCRLKATDPSHFPGKRAVRLAPFCEEFGFSRGHVHPAAFPQQTLSPFSANTSATPEEHVSPDVAPAVCPTLLYLPILVRPFPLK